MNGNKPFMKYVVRTTSTYSSHERFFLLECGHEEYHFGKRKPSRLHCSRCHLVADELQAEYQKAIHYASFPVVLNYGAQS